MLNIHLKLLGLTKCRPTDYWEYHDIYSYYSRLYYITDGCGYILFPDQGETYEMKPDHIYLIPPHTRFSLSARGHWHEEYNVEFLALLPNGVEIFSYYNYFRELPAGPADLQAFQRLLELNSDFEMIHPAQHFNPELYFTSHHNDDFRAEFETETLLLSLLKRFIITGQPREKSPAIQSIMKTVMQINESGFQHHYSLTETAAKTGYHPDYFNQLFQSYTGLNFHTYLIIKRLEKACTQLRETNDSSKQIAHDCGFSSAILFNRHFKHYLKMTPTAYRRQFLISLGVRC